MSARQQIVCGRRVVLPDAIRPAAIHIRDGVVSGISDFNDLPSGFPIFEAGDSVVMPGLVDTHVHINEPGRTAWEGFETATRAAAAGGVTTLIEMPLNSVPATTDAAAFDEKLIAAREKLHVDVGFWGGVVPGNGAEIAPLWDAGVFGFKSFLVPSGVDEFCHVAESDLRKALPVLRSIHAPLLVHAELPGPIQSASPAAAQIPRERYAAWLASRPCAAEDEALALLIRLQREFAARIHVVHLSSASAIPLVRQAKKDGLPLTAETCPHYLCFTAEEIPDGATEYKCAPPIRERNNREALWSALGEGVIDLIATDHSPSPASMKLKDTGDFSRAWGGISSLQLGLPAVWTSARQRGYSLRHMAQWMCHAPAELAGLAKRKGEIAVGRDADLVVWNPEASFRVEPEGLFHRHKLTPYARKELCGVVETTFLRGQVVYAQGEFPAGAAGRISLRGRV